MMEREQEMPGFVGNDTPFSLERYQTLPGRWTIWYPDGQEELAHSVQQTVEQAATLLGNLLGQQPPALEVLVAATADWEYVPPEDIEASGPPQVLLPYWTDVTEPPTLVVPEQMDQVMGEATPAKLALLLCHEVAHAFFEDDPRPWPEDSPLWADEWPLQFAAFWLFRQIHGSIEDITADLHQQFAESFQPEADGKTPVTVRGFDWYEDTSPEDYLEFALLLENFAVDLLSRYDESILPRFLDRYRREEPLLSDDVTLMLASVLGEGGEEWLESLVYF
jgi:hypothetical protein